jgi:hypothetical protein
MFISAGILLITSVICHEFYLSAVWDSFLDAKVDRENTELFLGHNPTPDWKTETVVSPPSPKGLSPFRCSAAKAPGVPTTLPTGNRASAMGNRRLDPRCHTPERRTGLSFQDPGASIPCGSVIAKSPELKLENDPTWVDRSDLGLF